MIKQKPILVEAAIDLSHCLMKIITLCSLRRPQKKAANSTTQASNLTEKQVPSSSVHLRDRMP